MSRLPGSGRTPRTADREDAALERERRERARRDRERLRSERPTRRTRAAGPERVELVDAPRDTPAGGVATRPRRAGVVGATAAALRAVPVRIGAILSGFAAEVLAVLAGIAGPVLRLVPGGRGLVERVRSAGTTTVDRGSVPRAPRRETEPRPDRRAPLSESQQRAAARRRQLLQRRLRIGLVGLLAASVIAAWVFVPASDAFRIRHVEVTGARSVGDLEIRARVDELLAGKTVFTVDEAAVERRLEELPFVREATVHRHLPGGLELHVVEYRPLALGYGRGGTWLVARDGRVLAKARKDEWAGRVPVVMLRSRHLEPGSRLDDEPALRLLTALPSGSSLQFRLIQATRFELTAQVEDADGTVEVRFGRTDQLRQKVLVAEKVLREARRRDRELLYLDVTVPSRPAPCAKATTACHLPRGPVADDVAATASAAETTVSPDERGGDELDVTATDAE
ncbi:MAG: hypothetical protein JWM86_487 [Thermoleophilia bacterium]|nr:hypothetical protein [Thermoleophilia bacterium]